MLVCTNGPKVWYIQVATRYHRVGHRLDVRTVAGALFRLF